MNHKSLYETLPLLILTGSVPLFIHSQTALTLGLVVASTILTGCVYFLLQKQQPDYLALFEAKIAELEEHKRKAEKELVEQKRLITEVETKYAKATLREFSKDTFQF